MDVRFRIRFRRVRALKGITLIQNCRTGIRGWRRMRCCPRCIRKYVLSRFRVLGQSYQRAKKEQKDFVPFLDAWKESDADTY